MPGSLGTGMGSWAGASSLHLSSGFGPGWPQRPNIRVNTLSGPGAYSGLTQHGPLSTAGGSDFGRYEGPPAFPGQRQPFRRLPCSAQLRTPDLRYTSSVPRMAPVVPYDHFPGPGDYMLTQYSQFQPPGGYPGPEASHPRKFAGKNGGASIAPHPKVMRLTADRMERSSIRDVYPDKRCNIICRPNSNPGPAAYSPLPLMDRIRMNMRDPPTASRGLPRRGRDLRTFLQSPQSLSATLAEVQDRRHYPPS